MSDPALDALAEMARNRGLKLVRSRVRTPGKRRFGKVGLTDASGAAVLGMDAKGPTATPEAVEEYLRTLQSQDWGASLGEAEPPRKRTKPAAAPVASKARKVAAPKPPPPPRPKPKPVVREARPADAARLAELFTELGHAIGESDVRKNLVALKRTGETPLVATLDKEIVGVCGVGLRVVIHRTAPLGRITALIVTKGAQGQGIGRMLVEAVEERLRKSGCKLIEVTSNDRRAEAHAFYRHLGYERTSIRFAKTL